MQHIVVKAISKEGLKDKKVRYLEGITRDEFSNTKGIFLVFDTLRIKFPIFHLVIENNYYVLLQDKNKTTLCPSKIALQVLRYRILNYVKEHTLKENRA